jgi:hypothetical protein
VEFHPGGQRLLRRRARRRDLEPGHIPREVGHPGGVQLLEIRLPDRADGHRNGLDVLASLLGRDDDDFQHIRIVAGGIARLLRGCSLAAGERNRSQQAADRRSACATHECFSVVR